MSIAEKKKSAVASTMPQTPAPIPPMSRTKHSASALKVIQLRLFPPFGSNSSATTESWGSSVGCSSVPSLIAPHDTDCACIRVGSSRS